MRVQSVATTFLGLLAVGVLSSPAQVVRSKPNRIRQDPATSQSTVCGTIIDQVNDGYAYFYASDAYACLTSVPFNPAVATRFVNYVNTTIQFQSTLAYLKSPPIGYQQPAVDVLGQLAKIQNNVTTGVYKNQYEFEIDLQYLLYQTHDSHLYLTAGITAAFSFQSPVSLTAASLDGKSLPKVYITADILKNWRVDGFTPSPIKTINNQTAVEYLSRVASLNSYGGLEAHTDWNQLFTMPTLEINGDRSILDGYIGFYPGDEINVTMENGTEYTDYWLALYNEPWQTGPLTTGGDFYNYFVLGFLPASYNESASPYNAAYAPPEDDTLTNSTDGSTNTTVVHSWKEFTYGAFPDPDVYQDGLADDFGAVVSGYLLHDVDAAVLSLPTFGQSGYLIGNFSQAVSDFISNATEHNITRIVIDLQQNTGGLVELAFSTFSRFFPKDVPPFSGSRRRIHPLADILGEAYTAAFDALAPEDDAYADYLADEWVVTPRLNAVTGQNFTSWAQYRGPTELKGDTFSLTERYNLSSADFDSALFGGWVPAGYTSENPITYPQPFQTKNIVLLTDGLCASTCALLVEMFTRVGVKTIVAGGLPITGPMQAVGGTRGAALWSATGLDQSISGLNLTGANVPALSNDGTRDSGVFTTILGVNLRDQVRSNDTEPLQFKYEAADCRIFYTLDNVYNMSRLWRDTVAAAFDDRSLCVDDSTGYNSKPAPPPQNITSISTTTSILPLDLTEPDDTLNPSTDMDPGLFAVGEATISAQVTYCVGGGCPERGAQCKPVQLPDCSGSYSSPITVKRCIPYKIGQEYCPVGTTWKRGPKQFLKTVGNESKKQAFGNEQRAVSVGPCLPDGTVLAGALCSKCSRGICQ